MNGPGRTAYRIVTGVALGVAALGVALPVLPTTPFLLVAAWSAAHHSPELETRLLTHPRYGAALLAWRRERALSRRSKRLAVGALAVSMLVTTVTVSSVPVKLVVGVILISAAAYLTTRPAPRTSAEGDRACA